MLQRMMGKKEAAFWYRVYLKIGEELELGVPPPDVWIENMGQRVLWGPEPELVKEGPPVRV